MSSARTIKLVVSGCLTSFCLTAGARDNVTSADVTAVAASPMAMIGVLSVLVAATVLWVLMLRRQVSEKTARFQQSESKFRLLVEKSLVGVYIIQDDKFAYVNPRMAEIFGYQPEEMVQCSALMIAAESEHPTIREKIQQRIAGGVDSVHYTFHGVRKDGSELLVEVLGNRTEYGGRPAVLGSLMDITEQSRAKTDLAEASNLLETLLANIPDYIYFKDRDSRFVRCSKGFEQLFNVPNFESLKGKTDFDFFLEEHARSAFDDEQEIIRTGKPIIGKLESEEHSDGRVTWALTTKMPWRDSAGHIVGTFGISKDVTEIKRAEAELAYERDLLHALMDNFPDSIYFKDLGSRFVQVSRSKVEQSLDIMRRQFQNSNGTEAELPAHLSDIEKFHQWIVGKTDFDTYTEERARAAFEDEQEIIRTGNPIIGKIERTPQLDGTVTWCTSTKMPWRDKDGRIIGTFGASRDITALKEAEAQLEAAHQRIVETSRMAGMAEVASDVLHNVGNVLNSVNVSCSLVIERVKASKAASLSKTASLLNENSARLGEFFTSDPRGQQIPRYIAALAEHFTGEQAHLMQELEQLLKHIEHIKQIVAMQQSYAKVAGVVESISPAQLVEDAIQINGAALARHDVHLRRDFVDVPVIETERHRVLQILVNLIRNAKYAMDDSGRQDKLLTIRMRPNGNETVQIEVADNGVGIPQENLTRIFSHGFTTRRNGHGFGLHSSALAIKELGGSLVAHSDGPGTGATFTLTLPLRHPAQNNGPK